MTGRSDDSPVELARSVPGDVRLRLVAASAGRCQLPGCNEFLYTHSVTAMEGNFAEAAHIVAFKRRGPRGSADRPVDINAFENLMHLCAGCHHLIDTAPDDWPVEKLLAHKREHEERIHAVTGLGPEWRTTVIQLRGSIGGQPVDVPASDIHAALQPRYPARLPGVLIDLTAIQRESPAFFDVAREQIRRELRPALRAELELKRVQHYSVFALAPIPVLVCLGRELGNKIVVDVFQRHRDQSWRWREDGPIVEYEIRTIRTGTDPACVAVQLPLSGEILPSSVPAEIDARFTVYEIGLRGQRPSVEFLRRREDLAAFRTKYREALRDISGAHDKLGEIHLLPAVPAPIAIACGQEVMAKAHPALVVYDNVKGALSYAITVNRLEDL